MSLKINCNCNMNPYPVNNLEANPIPTKTLILPKELGLKIFSYLNLTTLGKTCLASKEWKELASQPLLWKEAIYQELAFGKDKWAEAFGKDVVKDEDSEEEFSS